MVGSSELSVTSAVALVLAGIFAFILALTIALGGYGRGGSRTAAASAEPIRGAAPAASAESSEAELEYLLDTSEPVTTAGKRH